MKCLVTGGGGFIGSHVVDHLVNNGFETYVLVSGFRSGKHPNIINKDAHIVRGNLLHFSDMKIVTEGMDYVLHLAAVLSHFFESDPHLTIKTNINGTWNLKRACWENGVERIVFASSSFVYGEPQWHPIREDHPLNPKELYGVTKLAGEKILQCVYPEKVPYTILRLFNVYGPRQYPSDHYSSVMTALMPKAIRKESLQIHDDGTQKLDFVFVQDVARAFVQTMVSADSENEVFNVGSGKATSMNSLARMVNKIAENPTHSHYNREHPAYLRHVQADISKIREKAEWKPLIGLENGLKRTLEFFETLEEKKNERRDG